VGAEKRGEKESLNVLDQYVLTYEKKGRRCDDKYYQKDGNRLGVS